MTILALISFIIFSCQESDMTLSAPVGGYQVLNLKNGNTIKVGPDSKITYNSKKVFLDGEAEFDLRPDAHMEISTANGIIKAEDALIRVNSRRTTMNAFCKKGKMNTSNVDGSAEKELSEGGYVIYRGKNLAHAGTKNLEQMTDDKKWVFSSSSLKFILEAISAQFGVSFEYGDANLNKVFSGFVPRDDLQIALSIVLRSSNIEYNGNGSVYTLTNS